MYYSAGVKINLINRENRSPSSAHAAPTALSSNDQDNSGVCSNILSALEESNPSLGRDSQTRKCIYIIRLTSPSNGARAALLRVRSRRVTCAGPCGAGAWPVGPRCWCRWGQFVHALIHSSVLHQLCARRLDTHPPLGSSQLHKTNITGLNFADDRDEASRHVSCGYQPVTSSPKPTSTFQPAEH